MIEAAGVGEPAELARIAARLRAAGCVFAEDEARLIARAAPTPADRTALIERRIAGEPLEHLLGWAEFAGLRVAIEPGVFVPRRRTEFLIDQALGHLRSGPTLAGPPAGPPAAGPAIIVDLCCGAGAIALAVAASAGAPLEVHAADCDPVAVGCARRNLAGVGEVHLGDLYAPLPGRLRGRVDVLAVNAPYVPTASLSLMPPEARLHEPRTALDGGSDGLDVQRRVIAGAPAWLAVGGALLIETSDAQAAALADAFAGAGLNPRVVASEAVGATVVVGVT